MNEQEVIAEVRLIAEALAIPRVHPGKVSPVLRHQINEFIHRAGIPMAPWRSGRTVLTKPEPIEVQFDGGVLRMPVCKEFMGDVAIVETPAAKLSEAITQYLVAVVSWQKLKEMELPSEFDDWTPERAEQAIREAASALPMLCDRLAPPATSSTAAIEPAPNKPTDLERNTYYAYTAVEAYLMEKHDVSKVAQVEIHRMAKALIDNEIDRAEHGIDESYVLQPKFDAFIRAYRRAKDLLSAT